MLIKNNDTIQTYINEKGEQVEVRCSNCMSYNVELEEIDIDTDIVRYYCNECEIIFEIKEG